MTAHATATRVVGAPADEVFRTVVDTSRLPEWHNAITGVVEQPDHPEVGSQWIVEMHALGRSWRSRSMVEALDPARRRFGYRSVTDDGYPSWARWSWEVADQPDGTRVTVAVELRPRTFWRRVLFVHIRHRQLARTELPGSLVAREAASRRVTRPG